MNDWTSMFIAVNIAGSLLVASLMVDTTPRASIRGSFYDPQAMWGMIRRLFYLVMTSGMIGMALWTWEGWIKPTRGEMVFWLMIVAPLGLFLMIRWLKLVDQDQWRGWQGWASLTRQRDAERERHSAGIARH